MQIEVVKRTRNGKTTTVLLLLLHISASTKVAPTCFIVAIPRGSFSRFGARPIRAVGGFRNPAALLLLASARRFAAASLGIARTLARSTTCCAASDCNRLHFLFPLATRTRHVSPTKFPTDYNLLLLLLLCDLRSLKAAAAFSLKHCTINHDIRLLKLNITKFLSHIKVGVRIDSLSDREWTPLLEWSCGVGWEFRIGHQKGITCWKEIGLRARHLLTVLDAIVNVIGWGDLYDP